MIHPSFTKPMDEVFLVASILKRLKAGGLSLLSERIKCQKIQYFAQVFRVSSQYVFGLYIHGPYSPDLAHDLFAFEQHNDKVSDERFVSDEVEERFQRLRQFVSTLDLRMLEITATLHWLISAGYTVALADKKVHELKQASIEDLRIAHVRIGELL